MEEMLKIALKEGSPWFGILLIAIAIWKVAPKLNSYFDRWLTHSIDSGRRRDDAVVAINSSIGGVREAIERNHNQVISTIKEVAGEDKHAWRNKITEVVQGSFEDQIAETGARIEQRIQQSETNVIREIRHTRDSEDIE